MTREEFDIQNKLLQSAREHIDALEARIAAFEAAASGKAAAKK